VPGPRLFFIDSKDIVNDQAAISGASLRHIIKVLRLGKGDRIWIGDEKRRRYLIELTEVSLAKASGRILDAKDASAAPSIEITLMQSILKGSRMDLLIQKATELGAASILPITTERTVVKLSEGRTSSKEKRWQGIAKEASQQSGRWDVLEVRPITRFDNAIGAVKDFDLGLLLWEGENENKLRNALKKNTAGIRKICVLIGPEGGFTDKEIKSAAERGFISVSMGNLILRAETAAITAIGVIQYEFGIIG
jgi:16S rRNA (uracil1498-N3)-methyltransferase